MKVEDKAAWNRGWINGWAEGIDELNGPEMLQHPVVKWFRGEVDDSIRHQYMALVKDFHERFSAVRVTAAQSLRFDRYRAIWAYLPASVRDKHPDVAEIMSFWEKHEYVGATWVMRTAVNIGPIEDFATVHKMWDEQIPLWYQTAFGESADVESPLQGMQA